MPDSKNDKAGFREYFFIAGVDNPIFFSEFIILLLSLFQGQRTNRQFRQFSNQWTGDETDFF